METEKAYLKCDKEKCDYQETVSEILKKHVGKPCPKCGNNLLTKEDYEAYVNISKLVDICTEIVGDKLGEEKVLTSISYHNGNVDISIGDEQDE